MFRGRFSLVGYYYTSFKKDRMKLMPYNIAINKGIKSQFNNFMRNNKIVLIKNFYLQVYKKTLS